MKKWISWLLVAMLLLGLTSCGEKKPAEPDKSTESTKPTDSTDTGGTVVLTIAFPSDFVDTAYTPEALTAAKDFEWGQYVPFIQCNGQYYRRHMQYYDAGFLTSECTSLQDACRLYDKLNDQYLTQSDVVDLPFTDLPTTTIEKGPKTLLGRSLYEDMLFRSHIVSLSPDLRRINKVSFSFQGDENTTSLVARELWQDTYEVYQDGVLVHTYQQTNPAYENSDYFTYTTYETYFNVRPASPTDSIPSWVEMQEKRYTLKTANEQVAVYSYQAERYLIYSVSDMTLLYDITLVRTITEAEDRYMEIAQVVQDRYLLISASVGVDEPDSYYNCAYLYDLQTNEMTCLEDHAFNPSLSPDGKYLAYAAFFGEGIGIENGEEISMKQGFYIKNLQNDTTVFFEDTAGYIAGWVDEQILMETIGQ